MRIALALVLAACAAPLKPVVVAKLPAPTVVIDSPAPNELVRTTEIDVRGHFTSYDGRAWAFVDAVPAEVVGTTFVAKRVPVREGRIELAIDLADAHNVKAHVQLPIVVETPDRPRSSTLCKPAGCIRYEERGRPTRDASGRISNAIIVLSAFGFDERLDELWPDLVGPQRPLDTQRFYVVGIAGAPDDHGATPEPDALVSLVDALVADRTIADNAILVGAPSFGVEVALRMIARGDLRGPVLLVGGHDRPQLEPAMTKVARLVEDGVKTNAPSSTIWHRVSEAMVPASYTPAYLADASHAVEHGIPTSELSQGLSHALVERQSAYFDKRLPIAELGRRMRSALAMSIAYPPLAGRRVIVVANRDDLMMHVQHEREMATRLEKAGAKVQLFELSDPLGHSVFFRRVPLELERAVEATVAP